RERARRRDAEARGRTAAQALPVGQGEAPRDGPARRARYVTRPGSSTTEVIGEAGAGPDHDQMAWTGIQVAEEVAGEMHVVDGGAEHEREPAPQPEIASDTGAEGQVRPVALRA